MNSDVKFYLALVMKRMPVMLVLVLLGSAIGIAMALTIPPRYSAGARLLVENAQIPDIMAPSTVQTSADKQLQIVEERLMTRANMIDVANKYQVFADQDMKPDQVFDAMQKRTGIFVWTGDRQRNTVMEITFEDGSPQIAADIVNEFVTLVETESAEIRQTEAMETAEFFESEVARLSEDLSRKSAAIVAFKEANKDALPEEQLYRLNRQTQLLERLSLNSRDLATLREQRNRLVSVGTASGVNQPALTPEQQQLATLRSQLNSALSVYSESNPRVKMLRAQIEQLEASMRPAGDAAKSDPMQNMLDIQIADIDGRISFLEGDIAKIENELVVLQEAIEKTPENAIRLDALTREYDNVQTQYNQAVASLGTAKVGESIQVQGRGERVSVIERAIPPNRPSGPNRKLIAGGGFFAGAALAAVFFVLTELLNRAVRRPVDLTRGLGVQPLATIPFIEKEVDIKRRRTTNTVLVLAAILAIPLGLWALHTYYLPLDLLAERALDAMGL